MRVWNYTTGQCLHVFTNHSNEITRVCAVCLRLGGFGDGVGTSLSVSRCVRESGGEGAWAGVWV